MKLTRLSVLLSTLCLTATAQASTTLWFNADQLSSYSADVSVWNGNSYDTNTGATVGSYQLYKNNVIDPLANFTAYCFQPLQGIDSDMLYSPSTPYTGSGVSYGSANALALPVTHLPASPDTYTNFGGATLTAIQKLFNVYYNPFNMTAEQSAGFQIALWEVEHDTNAVGPTVYDLASGNFKAQNIVDNANGDVLSAATTYLQHFQSNSDTGNWVLTQWTNSGSQDFISADIYVPPVPEPATALLLSVGLFGLVAAKRKQGA